MNKNRLVSIVVPAFNEEEALPLFYKQLRDVLDTLPESYEIIFVNDGSSDKTGEIIEGFAAEDPAVRTIHFSRNFGHQAALSAGLQKSQGDYTISMDADGQHPPKLIPEMIRLADSGYDIILTQRIEPEGKSSFKKWSSETFYKILNKLSDTQTLPGGADFRLMNRESLNALIALPEFHRFLRGMVSWIGFRSVILPFEVPERLAGKTKYSLKKMTRLASDAVFSFSMVPLYIGLSAGALFFILALVEVIYVLSFWISGNSSNLAPGWSSLMFMMLIIGAILMIIMGFIGVYVGYIFQEVKHRPVYICRTASPDKNKEGDTSPS
ncbi:MAG: glycosyltransferase family 2 protein [Anaerolineaceae bacterium]|nr:glycosyltransferase family 2 protein [Anaerolineaceae bacterium]